MLPPMASFLPRFLRPKAANGNRLPEAPLWDHLDACGLAFRAPMQLLIDTYGAHPIGWDPGLDICAPTCAKPLFAGLDHPPSFRFSASTDLSQPAPLFHAALRASDDHRVNYARAIKALCDLFGEGAYDGENSGPNTGPNTGTGRVWHFGQAWLRCCVHPPARHCDAPSLRHQMFPKSRTEAAITFAPAWRPDS